MVFKMVRLKKILFNLITIHHHDQDVSIAFEKS
jgi:hypothetical protein